MSSFLYDDGKRSVEFPALTVPEFASLQQRVANKYREQNRFAADEAGFDQLSRAKFLRDSDPRSIGLAEIETILNDDREARWLLTFALQKAGKSNEESAEAIAAMTPWDRNQVAKHVAGLINLSPVPEKDRQATESMIAVVRRHYPGTDVSKLTMGEFYALIDALVPPEAEDTVDSWFAKNTVPGTEKKLVA